MTEAQSTTNWSIPSDTTKALRLVTGFMAERVSELCARQTDVVVTRTETGFRAVAYQGVCSGSASVGDNELAADPEKTLDDWAHRLVASMSDLTPGTFVGPEGMAAK